MHRLYVEAAVPIERELYLGLVLDRKSERIMVVASGAGRHGDRGDRPHLARHDRPRGGGARGRHDRLPGPGARLRTGAHAGPGEPDGHHAPRRLPRLPRSRRHHGGDQPAGGDAGRRAAGARLQDDLRRQRDVPPPQRERAARLRRGGPAGGAGGGVRAQLRGPGRRTSAASSTAPVSPWPRWT